MSNPRIRGLVFFVVGIAVATLLCAMPAFVWLPNAGLSTALPVIEVPGETVHYQFIGNFNLTNTFIGGLIAGTITLLWAVLNFVGTKGWTNKIPGRAQAWTEVFMETFYNFCDNLGGENFRKAPLLWPFVAAIFIFLLAGNWMKLIPGIESVGYIHCAYVGQSGYQRVEGGVDNTWRLWQDRALYAGQTQTEFAEEECIHHLKVSGTYYDEYDPASYDEDAVAFYSRLNAVGGPVPEEFQSRIEQASAVPVPGNGEIILTVDEEEEPEVAVVEEPSEPEIPADNECVVVEPVAEAEAEAAETDAVDAVEEEEAEAAEESEEAPAEEGTEDAPTEEASRNSSIVLTSTLAQEEAHEFATPEEVAAAYAELVAMEAEFEEGAISAGELEEMQCEVTQMVYPNANFPLSADELEAGRIQPYIFTITPFVRGVATDLSFNFGLAILAIIGVQIYGVMALGPAYFEKFLNLSALGNIGSKPVGGIDFIVGIIEIVSELGKIVSLAFRLFGNIFAGGIVLMVFPFLLTFFVPTIMIGLEIIIGFVQALVFAVLTLVFSVQAMEAHHGDDHDDHH
ncbi:MAG: F0F1 ATP synthase subunit A [Chloroflexota bacterium]